MRTVNVVIFLLTLFATLLCGCQWDGVIDLDGTTMGEGPNPGDSVTVPTTAFDANNSADTGVLSDSNGNDTDTRDLDNPWKGEDTIVLDVHVPPDFDSHPKELCVVILTSNPSQVPLGNAACFKDPVITPSLPFRVTWPLRNLNPPKGGVVARAVLFVAGGGQDTGIPVPFVDFIGASSNPFMPQAGGGQMNAGSIFLEPADESAQNNGEFHF